MPDFDPLLELVAARLRSRGLAARAAENQIFGGSKEKEAGGIYFFVDPFRIFQDGTFWVWQYFIGQKPQYVQADNLSQIADVVIAMHKPTTLVDTDVLAFPTRPPREPS